MSKTLNNLLATRPWIKYIDDERSEGNSIIVTLADGYEFADDPGCGVQGFDIVSDVKSGTTKDCVIQK
jgi:hypothetical protein